MKLYMFRTVPLSIIRSFPLYTQQWYVLYRFADSLRVGSVWNSMFYPDPARKLSAELLLPLFTFAGMDRCEEEWYTSDNNLRRTPHVSRKKPNAGR
jgi:hypothetical protein